MDTKMKLQKSLPPLVEGKIHGYLKLVVDEVIWSTRNFGEISVFVSWWGETSKSQFRPTDITTNIIRSQQDTTEIYAIRTNISLFEEYIKNCESIQLVIISDETNLILGTSQITDLLEIFNFKPYFRYVPIITSSGSKIGEIHISMKLEHMIKSSNTQLISDRCETKQAINNTPFSTVSSFKNQDNMTSHMYNAHGNVKLEESEIYRSILKSRRPEFHEPINKFNNKVTDKLVAQVVARAQRLRGELLTETCEKDALTCNYNSIINSIHSDSSDEVEAKLHECCFGKDTISSDENKALCTLRSTSLNPNWTDLASNSLKIIKSESRDAWNSVPSPEMKSLLDNALLEKRLHTNSEDTDPFVLVNFVRVNIESLTLSPAGYRRVKSTSSDNDNTFLSATYFVQYDMTFDYVSESGKKWVKERKPTRICSKKQTNEAIYFNHNSTYRISKLKLDTEHFIKFKIFVRHLNKKLLIELGSTAFSLTDVIKSEYGKVAKHLSTFSKGIKIGELNVIIELGFDSSHFEGQFSDTIISAKENIPILETQHKKSKPATETQPKPSNQVSPLSTGAINCLTIDSEMTIKNVTRNKTRNIDDKRVDIKNRENKIGDKVLLHGLIYVAEGQELPELNTYLICRAFWREDKTKSQVCNNTYNPFYQFCQLVPLVYDNNLLERVKHNYIIIEVYSRNNNTDNLLGLTKLPVHHLYTAFSDPYALPNLLLSKYPVVSVDGWVPIIDPVTGQPCGQLLALVALGTSEQIAFLEVSRGLRNINTITQTAHLENFTDATRHTKNLSQLHVAQDLRSTVETYPLNNPQVYATNPAEREPYSLSLENRECQTDISTVKEIKSKKGSDEEVATSEHSTLHNIVGRSTENLNITKMNIDRAAQTEISLDGKKHVDMEEHMCTNELNLNTSDESDNNSVPHNFHLSPDMYRSVGVGAEYSEEINQQPNSTNSNATFEFPTAMNTDNESTNSMCSQTTFRAVVEIECALHLPKIEKVNEAIEPSTYVTFQATRSDYTKRQNTYTITDVYPHSCNPKWNWKCDTKLPTELLLHDEKRLILKIWRIRDTDISTQINLEWDIVIGFSAIDLSILINGFPTVSGWFHIMDFTGKCNGQIKVCVTPLDNLSLFGKSVTKLNSGRGPTYSISRPSWFPSHVSEFHPVHVEKGTTNYNLSPVAQGEEKFAHSENQSNDSVMHIGFEDVSMSFLSLSLKKKLTEIDEITRRLQSRLHDITNTAFEDDLENEFELNESNSDIENNDNKIADPVMSIATAVDKNRTCQTVQENKKLFHNTEENYIVTSESSIQRSSPQTYINSNKAIGYDIMCSDSSKLSNFHSKRNLSNDECQTQQQNAQLMQHTATLDNNFIDYPERGTKTHINYLLDKLSMQFPLQSHLTKGVPIKRHVSSLSTNFKQSNNNLHDINTYDQELQVCSVPTQTDEMHEHCTKNSESPVTDNVINEELGTCESRNLSEADMQLQTGRKMSKVIREELVAEENSDTSRYDELTTYLVTSNIRHMDLNNILNPLFYTHLVPDEHHLNTSTEDESIKQLDNQYSKVFSTSISNRLNKTHNIVKTNASLENAEHFRPTPSGLSENIDDSIDVTVLHQTRDDDVLLASNNTESTTTLSAEESLVKSINSEVLENGDSTSTETSVLVLSRQAPDGGNPIEDSKKPLLMQQKNETQDSSSSTCN